MHLCNFTLELSSKPFTDDSEETMHQVAVHLFSQWADVCKTADVVSVMLWLADGSEILNYSGELSQTFEWACWHGCANPLPPYDDPTERMRRDTHRYPKRYKDDITPRSYAWLKRMIQTMRKVGTEMTGRPIRIGATYDNGPEFAISEFKYKLHPEIATAHTMFPNSVVSCTAKFHADSRRYAAFPNGIPEGTTVGAFLGAQFRELAKDVGFDYLWLSNGMGFGTETWGITGMLFDKRQFHPEKADEAARLMLDFWNDFFAAYPDCVIETRGSNFSAGVEMGTDACPFRELYHDFKIAPPVNSPWAALNFNTGLELAAWMSHIAELPADSIPFRFYAHDPWFLNSPWLDRFGREPWDLFQPMSISRIAADGAAQCANSLAILSADDSFGNMPDQVPSELSPLFHEAFDTAPDASAPFVWLYPFDEYCDMTRGASARPDIVFTEDMFIAEALQDGFPLNTVISTTSFHALLSSKPSALDGRIIVAPVTVSKSNCWKPLKEFIMHGGNVLFYGALDGSCDELTRLLDVSISEKPATGKVSVATNLHGDSFEAGEYSCTAFIHPQYSCGGLRETLRPDDSGARARANLPDGDKRLLALVRDIANGGKVGFVRAVLPSAENITEYRHFDYGGKSEIYPTPALLRMLAAEFGWRISCTAFSQRSIMPRTTIHRHDNAFIFTVYAPDTSVKMSVSTPYGAPLFTECNVMLAEGASEFHPSRTWRKECRCFVRQTAKDSVSGEIQTQSWPEYSRFGRRLYGPFTDAEVRFFPDGESCHGNFEAVVLDEQFWPSPLATPLYPYIIEETPNGTCYVMKHVTGYLHCMPLKPSHEN